MVTLGEPPPFTNSKLFLLMIRYLLWVILTFVANSAAETSMHSRTGNWDLSSGTWYGEEVLIAGGAGPSRLPQRTCLSFFNWVCRLFGGALFFWTAEIMPCLISGDRN